ncbi:MAG: hypothetical protein A4E57_03982 [Syntrophorhabdaceae bacterium PtaU1.Bin034]|nr:MAG: hypothetical protein A4E57_03982 [Syntrophorhabdaceae bacterium PtaU1.Bin034]
MRQVFRLLGHSASAIIYSSAFPSRCGAGQWLVCVDFRSLITAAGQREIRTPLPWRLFAAQLSGFPGYLLFFHLLPVSLSRLVTMDEKLHVQLSLTQPMDCIGRKTPCRGASPAAHLAPPFVYPTKNPRTWVDPRPGMPFSILRNKNATVPLPRGTSLCKPARRSSGFRIILLAASSHPALSGNSDMAAAFIPGYGGGSATDSHRLPCYGLMRPLED